MSRAVEVICVSLMAMAVLLCRQPASADDVARAVEDIEGVSDAKILDEFDKRRYFLKPAAAVTFRSLGDPFADHGTADLIEALRVKGRTIYGSESRRDWGLLAPAERTSARASVALFDVYNLSRTAGGIKLKTETFGKKKNLCEGQAFFNQASGAYCSGILVGQNLVLTAGHCVRDINPKYNPPDARDIAVVFGFHAENADSSGPTVLPEANVFFASEVYGSLSEDWALLALSDAVDASIATPVTGWKTARVEKDDRVFVIGFPSGLPLKYADDAQVRDSTGDKHFIANLDTFGGSSGSGVYEEGTRELVGVLTHGDADFVVDEARNCNVAHVCPASGCKGERVARISLVQRP